MKFPTPRFLILLINPIWYHSKCAFNLPCFFHFTALKVYRRQRQVLWQQSVTTILSNIPTFLYFPCSYYICDTNTCFWWQHSLPLPFPRRYWKRWNYSLKEWIIGFVNESYARICRIPMHIISRLPNQLQSHQFICYFFAFKIRTDFPILGYLFLNLFYNFSLNQIKQIWAYLTFHILW